jgi:hypothetical protein
MVKSEQEFKYAVVVDAIIGGLVPEYTQKADGTYEIVTYDTEAEALAVVEEERERYREEIEAGNRDADDEPEDLVVRLCLLGPVHAVTEHGTYIDLLDAIGVTPIEK